MDVQVISRNRVKFAERNSLLGLTSLNEDAALFDFGNVIVQKHYVENDNVRIISGGSFCYGKLVGKGMLTCSIQGEHFLTPNSRVILRTLRELSYDHLKGILLLVPSNNANLLNFGVAVERAFNDNLRIKLLAIKDDCYNSPSSGTDKNGLSGIVLISKIAGAMSERRMSLNEIYKYCEKILPNILSIGFNAKDIDQYAKCIQCVDYGSKADNLNKSNQDPPSRRLSIRLSLGDSDFNEVPITTHSIYIKTVEALISINSEDSNKLALYPDDNIVILLDNNGAIGKTEELLLVHDTIEVLQKSNISVVRYYISNNLKMGKDFMMTIMKIDDKDVLKYLDDPCNAFAWTTVNQGNYERLTLENLLAGRLKRKERLAPPIRGPKISDENANTLLFVTQFACDALISCEYQLNVIDCERSNGNTGTRLRYVAEVLIKRMKLNKIITNYPFTFFECLGKMLEGTIGGSSGCIYSIMFEAAAFSFSEFDEMTIVTPFIWLKSFEHACEALKKYGNIDYGQGTMYDPIYICLKTAHLELNEGANIVEAYGKGIAEADLAIKHTKMDYKYPDAGAHAVGIWMKAVFEGVKLRYPFS